MRDREGEGGLLYCSREMVADSARFPTSISYTILLIHVADCYPVVVDWWKGQVGGVMQNR